MAALIPTASINFIRLECGIAPSVAIIVSTGMQRDLGVYGDDAVEFLLAYSRTFQVDVSQLMAADYFDGEGIDILEWFKPAKKQRELTAHHLQQGIAAKRLDEQLLGGAG